MLAIEDQHHLTSTSTQFLIFNVFGDYVLDRGGEIWTADLLYLLGLLDVSDSAARSTLSRMVQRGWLTNEKVGRRSRYGISQRGKILLEQGNRRLREAPLVDWDGVWTMAVYSLPESKRELRNALRKQLIWLGFGRLAPGTWVTPHQRQVELAPILAELEVRPYVNLFQATNLGLSSNQEIVAQCWALPHLAADYESFLDCYRPDYESILASEATGLSPETCFTRRFWLTYHFQPFPRKDPNLPVELLPDDWPGLEARQLFFDYRRLMDKYVDDFLDAIVAGERPV